VDVYRIGVSLVMTHNVTQALALIGPQLLGMHTTVQGINQNFAGWATALGGVAGVLAGGAIAKGLIDIAKHGGAVNHELELMKIAGMSVAEIQSASAQAMKTSSDNLTTTYSENMKHLRELRFAFGDGKQAESHLTEVTKANTILNAVLSKHNVIGQQDQVWELVKSLEMKGLTASGGEFSSYVNAMTKVVEATGGKVTPAMFQSAFKYGRVSTLGWDESFIAGALPRLMQDWATGSGTGGTGSGGPGNALMTGFRQMVTGRMDKQSAQMMVELGFGRQVEKTRFRPAHVEVNDGLSRQFVRNPYEAIQSMMPAIMKKYGNDPDVLVKKLGELFPVRTFGAAATQFALQGRAMLGANSPYEKDIKLQHGAMDMLPAFQELAKNDYPTVLAEFNKQWTNMLEVLGSEAMKPGGPVLTALAGLASMFNQISQYAKANPEQVKLILEILAGVAAVLVVAGGIALASLVAVPLAISAVVVAIGAFIAIEWDTFKNIFNGIVEAFKMLMEYLSTVPGKIKGLFSPYAPGPDGRASPYPSIPQFSTGKPETRPDVPSFGEYMKGLLNPYSVPSSRDPMKMPMNFMPNTAQPEKQQFAFSLNVDGTVLGQTVADILTQKATFSTSAPSPNGLAMWTGGDHNFGTV
jgi:hypothetical protein